MKTISSHWTALITISALLCGPVASAQDTIVHGPLASHEHLPKKGVAAYQGTFQLTGVWAGITGSVQVHVDFATGDVNADLTIPPLGSGGATSPPIHYTPTGVITRNANNTASYNLTQGVSFSNNSPFISMNGAFSGPRARFTGGSFDGNFCVPEPDCGAIYVVRSVAGTFSAARVDADDED